MNPPFHDPLSRRPWSGAASLWFAAAIAALFCQVGLQTRLLASQQGRQLVRRTDKETGAVTEIEADEMDYDSEADRYVASGNVRVESARGRMSADRATAQMTPKNALDWVKADGHVFLHQKREDGVVVSGTGDRGEYREIQRKAELVNNVTLRYETESLAEPAVLTGARADIDLQAQTSVVTRTPEQQVKLVAKPKGKPVPAGQTATPPDPIHLYADRIDSNARENTHVATGNPVMTRGKSRLTADKIWFVIDPKTNDLKQAHAEGHVVFDGQDEKQGTLHATGDRAVYDQPSTTLTVTGHVAALHTRAADKEVHEISGDVFFYNTATGRYGLRKAGGPPAAAPAGSGPSREKKGGTR